MKNRILLILTGGTICSFKKDNSKKLDADVYEAKRLIVDNFKSSKSKFTAVDFDEKTPLNVLSENMTVSKWNELFAFLKGYKNSESYDGIIILHGTDTLAYTSALLSVSLCSFKLPVILVSSQLDLSNKKANGNANFKAAVELIMNGIKPNVYAVYRNSDGKMYVHKGAELLQCGIYSEDFYSKNMHSVCKRNAVFNGEAFASDEGFFNSLKELSGGVLKITPYVGLDYNSVSLDGVKAVVHGTYHSETACAEIKEAGEEYDSFSTLSLIDRCNDKGIPFIIEPCSENAFRYESTKHLLEKGAVGVFGMTSEAVFAKTLLGVSIGLKGKELTDFLKRNINNEFVY